jgi:phosphoenolpyruvate-protein kinase (PTS system EI component)
MEEVARGVKVFDHAPVRGRWTPLSGPDEVLALMDEGAEGVVAVVREAGATFLAPIYYDITAMVCLSGTPRSHIGIMAREYQLPCIMATVLDGDGPAPGTEVEVDCSGPDGVVRA